MSARVIGATLSRPFLWFSWRITRVCRRIRSLPAHRTFLFHRGGKGLAAIPLGYNAEFHEQAANLIDLGGSLRDEALAGPMHY
jgi:hypothetical protein